MFSACFKELLDPVGINPFPEVGNVGEAVGVSVLTSARGDKGVDAVLDGFIARAVKERSARVALEMSIEYS